MHKSCHYLLFAYIYNTIMLVKMVLFIFDLVMPNDVEK